MEECLVRCHCCDRIMSEKEITWNSDLNDFDLCVTCLEIAMDAAYCDGFERWSQEEFEDSFMYLDDVPNLDQESFLSWVEAGDTPGYRPDPTEIEYYL